MMMRKKRIRLTETRTSQMKTIPEINMKKKSATYFPRNTLTPWTFIMTINIKIKAIRRSP